MCRCGTSGHSFTDMVVLGGWLNLVNLKVFSSLNDSVVATEINETCYMHKDYTFLSTLLFIGIVLLTSLANTCILTLPTAKKNLTRPLFTVIPQTVC